MKQKFYLLLLLPLLFFTTILTGCKKQHDPNKAIQNLSVSYNEDISNILISEFSFNQEKLEIKNLDQKIFTFKVIKTTFENNSFIIRYCLVNNKTKQESEFREFSVTNFLTIETLNEKLKDELKKITIDYPNLKNTSISEFNLANIVTNLDNEYQISHQIIFQDVTKVDVKTTISHKKYSQVKETITTSFTGFLVTKQDEINFAAKAVSATINIPKEYRTIKNSEVTENDIKFTNYETALYDIVVLGFSEKNNELILSFQLKDKVNGELVSTNQEISFKLFEYYKEKLPEALNNFSFNFSNLFLNEITVDNLEILNLDLVNYRLQIELIKGLISLKIKYQLFLRDTSEKSELVEKIFKPEQGIKLRQEFLPGEKNGVVSNCTYFITLFSLSNITSPHDLYSKVFLEESFYYDSKKVNLEVISFNDTLENLTLLATFDGQSYSEKITFSGLSGIASNNSGANAINENTLTISFQNNDYLFENYIDYNIFDQPNDENKDKIKKLLLFPKEVSLQNNQTINLGDFDNLNFEITKCEKKGNRQVNFTFNLYRQLQSFTKENGIKNEEKRHLASKRNVILQYLTYKFLLTKLATTFNIISEYKTNLPSHYLLRYEYGKNVINTIIDYTASKEILYTNTYFDGNKAILNVENLKANDVTGELHLSYKLTLETPQAYQISSSDLINKTFNGFETASQTLLSNLSISNEGMMLHANDYKQMFGEIILLYSQEGTTEEKSYASSLVTGSKIIRNKQLSFLKPDGKYDDNEIHTPIYDLNHEGKGKLKLGNEDATWTNLHGLLISQKGNNKVYFAPNQIDIKMMNNVTVKKVNDKYVIKLYYNLNFHVKKASGASDETNTDIITTTSTVTFLLSEDIFN